MRRPPLLPGASGTPEPGTAARWVGLGLVLMLACRYNPSFSNTRCASGEPRCPSGFVCDTTMTPALCVSLTETGGGGRGGTPAASAGGAGGGMTIIPPAAEGGAGGRAGGSGGAGVGGGAGRGGDSGAGGAAGTSGPVGSGGSIIAGGSGGKAVGGMSSAGGGGGRVAAGSGGAIGSGGTAGTGGVTSSGGITGSGGNATGGTTVPECALTDTRCLSDTQVQSCSSAGRWDTIATCTNACVGQSCGGDCPPLTKRCAVDTPQSCDQTGAWKDATTGACPPGLCASGACLTITNYGFTTGSAESLAPSNNLVAVQVQLPAGMLVGLGLITTQTTGQHLIFGLYTDVSGGPGKLVQSTAQLTVATGTNEVSVAHTTVTAGTYWIVEVSDGTTHFASPGQSVTVAVSSFPFGPLPMNIVGALPTANGNAPDLYARVAN